MDVQERVFDLPVHRSSRWIFNCYLIEGDEGQSVIVDPGLRATAQATIDLVQKLDREGPVHGLCTHGHVDHVSGMPLLAKQCQAKLYLPSLCEAYLQGEIPRVFGASAMVRFLPMFAEQPFSLRVLKDLARLSREKIGFGGTRNEFLFPRAPSGFLCEGQALPGAGDWRVIETPGHTDDSQCFYHEKSKTLLSGDAVLTIGGRAWFNPEWVDSQASDQTEERLRALDVLHLLPGHGLPLVGSPWAQARSYRDKPPGRGILAQCSQRLGRW